MESGRSPLNLVFLMADSPSLSPRSCEAAAASFLLRLFLALRALLAGIEKFELNGTYSAANYQLSMTRMATGITGSSFLPLWATKGFALSLGYILIALGVALLLGLKPRVTLFVMGLVYIGLSFGLMAVQESEGVAWLGVHVGLCAAALLLARHGRFNLWPDRHD